MQPIYISEADKKRKKMIYQFKDLFNSKLIENSSVVVILGQYPIFNNIVVDAVRISCRGVDDRDDSKLLDKTFGDEFGDMSTSNTASTLSIDEFYNVCRIPTVDNRWFCSMDYASLKEKQKESLDKYIKKPSSNACLAVLVTNWKEHRKFLNNNVIKTASRINAIRLSFPDRQGLAEVVQREFATYGIQVAKPGVELFIMRMSSAYDDYKDTIAKIVNSKEEKRELSYEDVREGLAGTQNFVLDDLLVQLTKPVQKQKVVITRRVYKMLNSLAPEMGFSGIVNKLKYKVEDIIWLRYFINTGDIPVLVRYDINKVRERIGKEHKINKLSDTAFRRYAKIASLTSLRDWYYIKMILSSVKDKYNEAECEKALLAVANRAVLTKDRLYNSVGVKNTIEENLVLLNSTPYEKEFVGFTDISYLSFMNITEKELLQTEV